MNDKISDKINVEGKIKAKPCWICLHGRLCINGLYCLKHKRYVEYQDTSGCEDKELSN